MKITTSTAIVCILAPVGLGQTELQLTPSDTAQFARFGISAAVDGARTVIGATAAVTAGAATGAAYVFDTGTGLQTMRLFTTDTVGARFAQGVAVEGNRVYVTAPFRHQLVPSFQTRVGGAYVFDAATGQQLDLFLPPGVVPNTEFGLSVDVDGGRLAVGARATTAPFVEPGTVYVLDALTGQQLHLLLALDGQDEDELGESVAIDGGLVVSGAPGDDDNGFRSGSAYVFDALTGAQLFKLVPNDPSASQNFGFSVAIQGRHVVVGATGGFGGSAYVFDALTGQQLMKLVANDAAAFDLFGHAVAIEGGRVIVSAPQRDELGLANSGAVYVFDLANGQQLSKFRDSNGGSQHFFGYALAASRDDVAVGSPFANTGSLSNSGTANVFDLDGGPNGVISYCDPLGANTVSSSGALLSSTGGFGTSAATFNITGIPNSFGLLFAGNGETSSVVGCGTLCVTGSLVRGPVLAAQGNQILGATFDMAPISTPHIQYWFREIGACPGGSSNLSNALKR